MAEILHDATNHGTETMTDRRFILTCTVATIGIALAVILAGCTGPIPKHDPFEPPQFEGPPETNGPAVICDERGCEGDFDALRRLPGEAE